MLLLLAEVILAVVPTVAGCQDPQLQNPQLPTVTSATDGIFAAFRSHPLVGLGDSHGLAQEEDFYAALIRDKRFAEDVSNVVVKFGDAAQQETLDRYLAGENIPYNELRKVWSDTVGWTPTVTSLGYINFYAQVRQVNLELPPEHRIHVWLGDPPIHWSTIKTREDFFLHLAERDRYPADIIKTQILAKNKKALVIYGSVRLFESTGLPTSLSQLVDSARPGAFFVITPYIGFDERSSSLAFERAAANWPAPALAMRTGLGMAGDDALLYLGPSTCLTWAQGSPDLYLDATFRAEIDRRVFLTTGNHLSPLQINPVSLQYLRPNVKTDDEAAQQNPSVCR